MRTLPHVENFLRTPDERFQNLPDFDYTPHYTQIGGLRVAHIDEGPRDGPVVLLMHGEPAWSFLYRKMIPVLVAAGMRVLVPDQVGFGRTDKPTKRSDYTYDNHVQWMSAWLESVDAKDITLFCQDWGSLIGLRMVAEMPDRFARIALSNGGLPTGKEKIPRAFHIWRAFAMYSPWFPIGKIVRTGCAQGLSGCGLRRALPQYSLRRGCQSVSHLGAHSPQQPGKRGQRKSLGDVQSLDQAFHHAV